jgi:glutathione synthase/RimK-type ligase-like ATP-grasp enzyme
MRSFLRMGETVVDLAQLHSVWSRRPQAPVPHPEIQDPKLRDFVAQDARTFVQDLWNALPCLWVPGHPAAIQRAQLKASQLGVAAEVGLELPPTLVTTSRKEFLDFYNEHNGNVISKVIGPAFDMTVGTSGFVRYTEVVSKRDLGYAGAIEYSPAIFQAYVPKRVELRITVVGQRVFAVEIHSQLTHHTRHDWRRYDLSNTPHLPHALPCEIEERCVSLVKRLELCYGAIDMILTPDGRYVFVEINPSGQYLWIETQTGVPISAAICDLLIAGRGVSS